ncbi:DUF6244 family protein [Micromonospora fulviviridis]|uniref:DUF6244 family protein n=1 Tax=Micromonospora fulviviridis TaxID=47860 RepID=UPI0037A28CB2
MRWDLLASRQPVEQGQHGVDAAGLWPPALPRRQHARRINHQLPLSPGRLIHGRTRHVVSTCPEIRHQPGPLLHALESIKQALVLVFQRTGTARQYVEGHSKSGRRPWMSR